jgi:hypothetical protein
LSGRPGVTLFFRTLSSFSRVIRFDRRGTGVSDRLRLDLLPPRESWPEELTVVLDTVGSEQAAIMAQLDAGPMAASMVPSRSGDEQLRRWFARFQRAIAPPGATAALQRALAAIEAW